MNRLAQRFPAPPYGAGDGEKHQSRDGPHAYLGDTDEACKHYRGVGERENLNHVLQAMRGFSRRTDRHQSLAEQVPGEQKPAKPKQCNQR